MVQNRHVRLDLEPFNVNGVIHVGADQGQFADYYHKLGVNKVLWVEKDEYKYKDIYSATCKFGMDQQILICHLMESDAPPLVKKFLTIWRENGPFIDMDTYDLLHIATAHDRWKIVQGFDFLLDFFKEILITDDKPHPDHDFADTMQSLLGPKGFTLNTHTCSEGRNEFLFGRKR